MTAHTHSSPSSANHPQDAPNTDFAPHTETPVERSIGEIISQANNLSPEQIESILEFQRSNGVRFGDTDELVTVHQVVGPHAIKGADELETGELGWAVVIVAADDVASDGRIV